MMPDIFTSVWVKLSQNYLDKTPNIINAGVYLKRICNRTDTSLVSNHDGTTIIHGQWAQILLLHKLLTSRHRKKICKRNISERLLQKYRIQRQRKTRDVKKIQKSEDIPVALKSNGSRESNSANNNLGKHVIRKSKTCGIFEEKLANDVSEITELDCQIGVNEMSLRKRREVEKNDSEATSIHEDENDAGCFPNQMETDVNEKMHLDKTQNAFKCLKCDFTSNHKNSVRDHELRIHFAVPEKCHLCKKVFPSSQHLKRHMITHKHSQCICDICGKIYKNSRTLEKHKKIHAINYKTPNFECLHCKKSFSSKSVLENHVETQHAGKKPAFLCATCGKAFTRKYSLEQHQLIHIGSRLLCDVCHKSFSCESSLRDHKKIHSDMKQYKCLVCSKSFKQRTSLQKHSKIHTGDKSFKCTDCGRGFTQKQALQRHERSHKGLKPFTCKICHKSYGDSAIIRKHLILVHKINKDPLKWKEDIEQNEYDSSFDISYNPVEQNNVERSETTQMATYNTYESGELIPTENVTAIQLPITNEHNAKSLPVTLPEDLSMSTPHIHHIQSQMHQMPMSMYQHSQSLYNEHVDPSGVDHSVYPTPHDLSSVANYPYISSSQTQPDQNVDNNNHDPSNPYLTTSQSQSADNMEDNPTTSHPYLSSQPHPPPPHVEEDHNSSSHQYSDSMLELTSTQQPEVLSPKRTPDTDSTENLSLSTLYAYYSSLASQYLNLSGYTGYNQQTDDPPPS